MAKRKSSRKKSRREVSVPLEQFGWTPEMTAAGRKMFGPSPERLAALAEQQRITDRLDRFIHSVTPPKQVAPEPPTAEPVVLNSPPPTPPVASGSPPSGPKPVNRKGGRKPLKIWEMVELHFDPLIASGGRYLSLGNMRDAVKAFLKAEGKGLPDDRTIERWINRNRPQWVA